MKYIKIFLLALSVFTIFTTSTFAKEACIGEKVILNYTVSGATGCGNIISLDPVKYQPTSVTVSGNTASGNYEYTASVPATFSLTCYSPATQGSDSLNIKPASQCCTAGQACPTYDCPAPNFWNGSTCVAPAVPTANLTAGRTTATPGERVDFNWSSTGGSTYSSTYSSPSCGAGPWGFDGAAGNSGVSGSYTPNLNQVGCNFTFTYTVTAANGQQAASSVNVSVVAAAVPVTWTRYCTLPGDANLNQIWEYDNSTPRNYRGTKN